MGVSRRVGGTGCILFAVTTKFDGGDFDRRMSVAHKFVRRLAKRLDVSPLASDDARQRVSDFIHYGIMRRASPLTAIDCHRRDLYISFANGVARNSTLVHAYVARADVAFSSDRDVPDVDPVRSVCADRLFEIASMCALMQSAPDGDKLLQQADTTTSVSSTPSATTMYIRDMRQLERRYAESVPHPWCIVESI